MKRFVLALVLSVLAAGCVVGVEGCSHHAPHTRDDVAPTWIALQNVLSNGYQLYFTDGQRRLNAGNIGPLETARLRVPPELVYPGAHLALTAIPSTSARTLSVPFIANPGATIRLMLGR